MRICYSPSPVKAGKWSEWRAGHWHVYRTDSEAAPVPRGATEIRRGEELPVSDEEIQQGIAGQAGIGASLAADIVRGIRYDPGTHDWKAWAAPLHLTADEASQAYVDAMTAPKTIHSHIVLRPCHSADGWFAWIGLGSLIDAILRPDLSARWDTRDEAIGAAFSVITDVRRQCWAEIEQLLDGWDSEAIQQIRDGRVPVIFGVVPWSQLIAVHEGDSAGTSSWDLPVVERLPDGAAIEPIEARRESECNPAARKAALRARKRYRRSKRVQRKGAAELGSQIASALVCAGCTKPDGSLSTYQAEQRTGINNRNIAQIVSGETSPSVETLNRIFEAIGWEVTVIFRPKGGKPAGKPEKAG
jgi:transcriptional regulator with XRE-family HTH domain